jgi:hypothetical protein
LKKTPLTKKNHKSIADRLQVESDQIGTNAAKNFLNLGDLNLPTKITQLNDRIAEVRLICESCGEQIGTLLMRTIEAEAQRNTKVVCQNCRKVDAE